MVLPKGVDPGTKLGKILKDLPPPSPPPRPPRTTTPPSQPPKPSAGPTPQPQPTPKPKRTMVDKARQLIEKAKADAKAKRTREIAQEQQQKNIFLPPGIDPQSKLGKVLASAPTTPTPKKPAPYGKTPGTYMPPPEPEILTQQQYVQETYETTKAIRKQKSDYYAIQESIDPKAWYRTETGLMLGAMLKSKLEKIYFSRLEKAELQSQAAWSQALNLPTDTTITKTDEGYEFKFRDTSLDWSKGEFAKIDKLSEEARKNTEKQFSDPVAGVTGAVQHVGAGVAEFGFGAVSSFGALIKPVLDYTIGDEKSRGSHFISPLDVVFEPIGWSPKGSTELMKDRPIFIAGGLAAEGLQAYGMTQALKPVSTGVKIGGKFVGSKLVKKSVDIYGKFTKVFPEEKFVSGGIKVTRTIVAKGESELPETIYRWGTKGYRKGLELTSAGVKTTIKEVPGVADDITRNVLQKTKYGKDGVKRVWLSPEKYGKAEQEIAEKLGLGKVVEKGYRTDIKAGVGTARELTEKTQWKLNWSGKRLLKKYGYTEQLWKVGDEKALYKISSTGDDLYKGFVSGVDDVRTLPSGETIVGKKAGGKVATSGKVKVTTKPVWTKGDDVVRFEAIDDIVTKSTKQTTKGFLWETDIKDIPIKQSLHQYQFRSGKTPFITGAEDITSTLKGVQQPIKKSWLYTYRTPFLQNIKGQVSLSMQDFKTKLVSKPSSSVGGRSSLLSKLNTKTIPSSLYTSAFEPSLDITTVGLVKAVSGRQVIPKTRELTATSTSTVLKPDIMALGGITYGTLTVPIDRPERKTSTKTRQDYFNVPKYQQDLAVLPKMDQGSAIDLKMDQAQMVKMDLITDLVPIPDLVPIMDVPFKKPPFKKPPSFTTFKPKPGRGFLLPPFPIDLTGAGGTDFGFGFTTPISRKRKHRTGDILAELSKGFDF